MLMAFTRPHQLINYPKDKLYGWYYKFNYIASKSDGFVRVSAIRRFIWNDLPFYETVKIT